MCPEFTFTAWCFLFLRFSVAVSASEELGDAWFSGCVRASGGVYPSSGGGDLDPVQCSARCLKKGCSFAAVTSGGCYCGKELLSFPSTQCLNTSKHVPGQSKVLLPTGVGEGDMALYKTLGPFLDCISFSVSPEVITGKPFMVQVFGKLAGPLNQSTGILGFGWQDLSNVTVEFLGMTPKGQSSLHVNMLDDGSFNVSSNWSLEAPGTCKIRVIVTNILSTIAAALQVDVVQPSPGGLEITLLHGPLGCPSCIPLLQSDSYNGSVKAAFLNDTIKLQAKVDSGSAADFRWCLRLIQGEETVEQSRHTTTCPLKYKCSSSNLEWIFSKEGLYMVSVNATSSDGWVQEKLFIHGNCTTTTAAIVQGTRPRWFFLLFNHTGTAVVGPKAKNILSSQSKSVRIWVDKKESSPHNGNAVKIYAADQAYPTNTEVTFWALTDVRDSMELLWHFGDSTSARTMLRTITKRYRKPGRYNVTVVMVTHWMSATSEPFPIIIQKAVKLNRLVHQAAVLQNHMLTISCRVNAGSDLNFLWRFGDGATKLGQSTEQHVFHSVGEFTVEVTVFNLVSNASLETHIFVVDKPCQPPPVKNMGPLTLKVRRYEAVRLGVTYETEFDCDIFITGGIKYTWTLYDSTGQSFSLPHTEIHRQTLILPNHFLHYDTYTAVAKVQVVGSVVYSNYSVRVQVLQSPPVAVIRGSTNVFINNKNTTVVTLDGTKSHDLDFPHKTIRLSWTCKPISTIHSSCFDRDVPLTSPVLTFPATFLKQNFDQFQFTLTIESAGRSASSDVFLTVKANLLGKVCVDCPQCQKNQVNWDQPFSVRAFCEDCQISPNLIHYTWSLYQVNASSRPVNEVPFCYTVDLSAPSAIKDTPTASSLVPETSPLPPSDEDANPLPASTSHPPRILWERHRRGEELFDQPPEEFEPFESSEIPFEYSGHVQYTNSGRRSTLDSDAFEASADWDFPLPILVHGEFQDGLDTHYEPFLSAKEAESEISPGRTTVEDGESFSLGDDSEFDPGLHREEGSNLVDARPPVLVQERTLLDLSRDPVAQWILESYTYTGLSSSQLNFKPFSLRPGSMYMLEAAATDDSQKHFLGRTQFFFKTQTAPKGVMCQVQPTDGVELLTVFSIFCTSGKEDLLYKYSFSVGDKPPQTLYQGRDFEYYFSLPAGDTGDDYKVTVYIEIRSSTDGGATRPCPVTVTVQPQFVRDTSSSADPVLELSQIALRNLSSLVGLGNTAEILNYISIVTNILNRLGLEPEADTESLTHLRNILVCIVCEIETTDQVLLIDTISVLRGLLRITNQVTLSTARKVTLYLQAISEQLTVNQDTISAMVSLLSHNLKAVNRADLKDTSEIHPTPDKPKSHAISTLNVCLTRSTNAREGLSLAKHLVDIILHTVSKITLEYILFHKVEKVKLSAGLVSVYATYQKQRSTAVSGGASVFFLPTSFVQHLDTCVISVVTELNQSPYTWADYPGEISTLSGPVVDMSFFRCGTRRKIPIQFLSQPLNVQLQPPKNQTFTPEYALQPNKINYHSFNISHEHLQHAIQIHMQFMPLSHKMFPVMLLFSMFEKPTPSVHHLRKIYNWESSVVHITLPPSYFSAAGVGYLALLNADFEKPHKWRPLNNQVSYSVAVDSTQCLSWDSPRGAWTPHHCKTQAGDLTSAVNCSCHQLWPVTVVQQHITSSHDKGDVDPFLSVSYNWTVLIVLVLSVCFYITALVLSRNTDVVSGKRRVHYLNDNLPCETYFYAVTIHTGLCSAAVMSAKVYIILCGENGFSQTKELQVPGCTLFRRNSQDTFIISAAESLGSLCGIHIWHDNSGPTPTWYLKYLEVCELNRDQVKGRAWLFVSQSWLAVDKSDGRVERMLRVCSREIGFAKMLSLKVCDYMADFHIWISVYSCPNPNSFTHCQRLSLCILLLLGYACVSTVVISQSHDKFRLELDVKDLSVIAITTGILSVILVLPAATLLSLLFRLCEVKILRPELKCTGNTKTETICFEDAQSLNNSMFEPYFSWSDLQQWLQEAWRKKYQDTDLSSVTTWDLDDKNIHGSQTNVAIIKEDIIVIDDGVETQSSYLATDGKNFEKTPHQTEGNGQIKHQQLILSQWLHCVAWVLWQLVCTSCLVVSALLSVRFNNSEVILWIQSLLFSLVFCIFFIHPLLVLTMAVVVSMWYRNRPEIQKLLTDCRPESIHQAIKNSTMYQRDSANLLKLLEARQRVRYLHLVRPPTLTELRKSRNKRKKDSHIRKTVWDSCVFASMLFLMLCVTYGSFPNDYYNLNRAVRKHFISGQNKGFMSIQTYDDWWRWAQSNLLNKLYKNTSDTTQPHIVIGEPVLWKTEVRRHKAFSSTLFPNCHPLILKKKTSFTCSDYFDSLKMATTEAKTGLGNTKTNAASKLKQLSSEHWIGSHTVALKVQFTLYSPAPYLFTSVGLSFEQSGTGALLPSASVQSVTVFHVATAWDYVVVVCQLLFLILLLLRLCDHILVLVGKGLKRYYKIPSNWLEGGVLILALVYYVYCLYRTVLVSEAAELLQRQNYRTQIDFSQLASCDQKIRSLRGTVLFLLTLRYVSLVNKTMLQPCLISSLLWLLFAGLIFVAALSPMGNLLHVQRSWVYTFLSISVKDQLNSRRKNIYHGAVFVLSRLVWTVLVINVVSSSVKCLRRRRDMFTTAELVQYIKRQLFSRWTRSTHIDHDMEKRTYYLEEFESLLDELLFRLDVLSNPTLPSEPCNYRNGSPVSTKQDFSKIDTLDYLKTQMTEPLTLFHTERSGPDVLNFLQPRDQRGDKISEETVFLNKIHQDETRSQSQGPCILTLTQATSSEMVVEVLIHKEQDRDCQHTAEGSNNKHGNCIKET